MEKISRDAFTDLILVIVIWRDWKEKFDKMIPFLKHYFTDDEIHILIKSYLEYALCGNENDNDFICIVHDEEYVINDIENLYDVIMIARKR